MKEERETQKYIFGKNGGNMTTEISRVYTEELLALCHIFDKYENYYEDLKIL